MSIVRPISLFSDGKRSINYSLQLEHGGLDSAHNEQQVNQLSSLLSVTESNQSKTIQQETKQPWKQRREESSERPGKPEIKIKKSRSSGDGVPNSSATNQPNGANPLPSRYQLPATPATATSTPKPHKGTYPNKIPEMNNNQAPDSL